MIHTRRAFLFPIDVLDAFGKQPPVKPASQTTTSSKPPTVSATPPVLPPAASAGPSKTSDEDFAEVFEREMAAMLRDLVVAQDPSGSAGDKSAPPPVDNSDRDRAIREAWEKMLEKSMDDAFSGVAGDQGATDESEDAFQKNVKEAMERLRRSDTDLQVRFHWDIFLTDAQYLYLIGRRVGTPRRRTVSHSGVAWRPRRRRVGSDSPGRYDGSVNGQRDIVRALEGTQR